MGTRINYRDKIRENNTLTLFEKKVLTATMDIPAGEVRSYAWIAERVGSPRGARAVGNALSKNPYAPHVPCHRVIASDGSIGGYSGQVAKKIKLLEGERNSSA
jgi:O-6-methylguanine DNA methyltransferase